MSQSYDSPQLNTLLGGTPTPAPAPTATATAPKAGAPVASPAPKGTYDSSALNTLLGGGSSPSAPTAKPAYDSPALSSLMGGGSPSAQPTIAPVTPTSTDGMFAQSKAQGLGSKVGGFFSSVWSDIKSGVGKITGQQKPGTAKSMEFPVLSTKILPSDIQAQEKELTTMKSKVDTSSQASVDAYNKKLDDLNKNIDEYNRVQTAQNAVGIKNPYKGTDKYQSVISADDGTGVAPNGLQNLLIDAHLPQSIVKNTFTDSLGGTFDDSVDKIDHFVGTLDADTHTPAERIGAGLDAGAGVANLIFSPISAIFAVAGTPIKVGDTNINPVSYVNEGFGLLGKVVSTAAGAAVDALPISQKNKDAITPGIQDVSTLIAQILVGKVAAEHGIPIVKDKINDIQTAITKDIITKVTDGKSVYFESSKIKDIWQTGSLLTDAEKNDVLNAIGGDRTARMDAIKNGININVSPETLITLQDKPYWSKIKQFFGFDATPAEVLSRKGGESQFSPIRGYLKKGDTSTIHPTILGETADHLATHGADLTHTALQDVLGASHEEASHIIKTVKDNQVAEAQKNPNLATDILNKVTASSPSIPAAGSDLAPEVAAKSHEIANDYYDKEIAPKIEAGKPVVVGADNLKDHYNNDYDLSNHKMYSAAANQIFEKAVSESPSNTVKFTVGGTGAGKSDFVVSHATGGDFSGVVYDSTGFNYAGLKKQIAYAESQGKEVKIYGVIPDIAKSRAYTFAREANGEHPVTEAAFIRTHVGAIQTMIQAIKDGHDVYVIDTRGIMSREDIGNKEFIHNPLADLEKLEYNEDHVKQTIKDINQETFRETIARGTEGSGEISQEDGATQKVAYENLQGGFIAPGAVIESLDKAGQEYIKNTLRPIELSKDTSESFYKLQGEQQATLEITAKHIDTFKISAQDNQQAFRFGENPNIEVSDVQKETYKQLEPVLKIDEDLTKFIKAKGYPVPEDEEPFLPKEDVRGLRYMPRTPMDKPSPLQRVLNPVKGKEPTTAQGGILARSTASLKSRVYKALVNPEDHNDVRIVAEKKGSITELRDGGKTSTDLGGTKQKLKGKDHVGGMKGDTFIDKNGRKWTVGHATTDEITEATGQKYYQDAVSSVLLRHAKLAQIARGIEFTNQWKASPEFAEIAKPAEVIPPPGWKPTTNFNFRNYNFEPRTAEVLDDMQGKMANGNYNDAFSGINNALADSIFFNGLAHPINVIATYIYNRGVSGLAPQNLVTAYKAIAQAAKALKTKNEDYLSLLRDGAHLMSSDVTSKSVAEQLQKKFNADLNELPKTQRDRIAAALQKIGGQFTFKKNVVYKFSHNMAWLSNDLFTIASINEAKMRYGMTQEEAIKETAKFIPDYRQRSRLLDAPLSAVMGEKGGNTARVISKIMYNKNISMFGSYHVGLLESLANSLKDTVNVGEGFSKEANKTRARGADKLAMLAVLMLVVYPWLDKKVKEITGNDNTYVTRSGITKYPYLFWKGLTGQATPTQVITGVITPSVGTQAAIELGFNRDFFTGNNIYGTGGEGAGGFIADTIAPVAEAKKVATGSITPGSFAATLLGVHTPKNTQLGIDLNNMIYTEKPQVLLKVKGLIAAGHMDEAVDALKLFNNELKDKIKATDIAGGNSGSDARVQYFLQKYGARVPSEKTIQTYTTNQGKSIVQKRLPDGKPVVVKGTPVPARGVIGVVTTYAKAIGTDPITAFKDIFKGQTIKDVTAGTIIVERMSLADSTAAKVAAGGNNPTMKLDHIIPLEGGSEAGGDNSNDNLQMIPTEQWKINSPIENFLGAKIKAGTITAAQVREVAIRFKAGQGEILSPTLMNEYKNKYNSQPLTADEVFNYPY